MPINSLQRQLAEQEAKLSIDSKLAGAQNTFQSTHPPKSSITPVKEDQEKVRKELKKLDRLGKIAGISLLVMVVVSILAGYLYPSSNGYFAFLDQHDPDLQFYVNKQDIHGLLEDKVKVIEILGFRTTVMIDPLWPLRNHNVVHVKRSEIHDYELFAEGTFQKEKLIYWIAAGRPFRVLQYEQLSAEICAKLANLSHAELPPSFETVQQCEQQFPSDFHLN